jgi:hypothetical protein
LYQIKLEGSALFVASLQFLIVKVLAKLAEALFLKVSVD